jgi:pimeloyl-ACP methyl ester carboxylesterase
MSLELEGNAQQNFSDLPKEEALKWAAKMPSHSLLSFPGELTYPGYKDVPVSYLFTEKDLTVLPKMQEISINNVEQATGKKVDVHRIDAGHIPHLSKPDEVAAVIRRVAGEQV